LTNKSLKTLVGLSANQLRPVGSKTASGLQLIFVEGYFVILSHFLMWPTDLLLSLWKFKCKCWHFINWVLNCYLASSVNVF